MTITFDYVFMKFQNIYIQNIYIYIYIYICMYKIYLKYFYEKPCGKTLHIIKLLDCGFL